MEESSYSKGIECYMNKQYEGAIFHIERAIGRDEDIDIGLAYYNIGCCYIKINKFNTAIYQLNKALDNGHHTADCYYNIAYSYVYLNNPKLAYHYINIACAINPNDEDMNDIQIEMEKMMSDKIKSAK